MILCTAATSFVCYLKNIIQFNSCLLFCNTCAFQYKIANNDHYNLQPLLFYWSKSFVTPVWYYFFTLILLYIVASHSLFSSGNDVVTSTLFITFLFYYFFESGSHSLRFPKNLSNPNWAMVIDLCLKKA